MGIRIVNAEYVSGIFEEEGMTMEISLDRPARINTDMFGKQYHDMNEFSYALAGRKAIITCQHCAQPTICDAPCHKCGGPPE